MEGSKPVVVVLEDNADFAFLLKVRLSWAAFDVIVRHRVEEAVQTLRKSCVQALLTDLDLGAQSGFELLQLVEIDPSLRSIPVVVLTASAKPADRAQALEMGAAKVVEKSGDPAELLAGLRELLGGAFPDADAA